MQVRTTLGLVALTLAASCGDDSSAITPDAGSGSGSGSGSDSPIEARVYGDGSAGPLSVPSGDVYLADPNAQYSELSVAGTLSVPTGTVLRVRGACSITGNLYVNPGAKGGENSTTGYASQRAPYSVAAHPGIAQRAAGAGQLGDTTTPLAGGKGGVGVGDEQTARTLLRPGRFGGGGGMGGASFGADAGGSVVLLCEGPIATSGQIYAAGNGLQYGGGGGGGGIVVLASSESITQTGTIDVRGGDGGPSTHQGAPGGGGGGGIVHLVAPAISSSGMILVAGGAGGAVGTMPSSTLRVGGGGGGASGGDGGQGGMLGNNGVPMAGEAGDPGYSLTTMANPLALF